MRKRRVILFWRAATLATTGLLSTTAWAQLPVPPTGPVPIGPQTYAGSCPRTFHERLHDTFFGRPAEFVEPPVGFYLAENFGLMRAKADPHRFTLYQSDFLPGTNRFSPTGASRFNIMASRLGGWLGPVVIEWSPDEPGLAESRRAAVLATLQGANLPIVPERVVIGPSPYPGTLGADAANYYNVMIGRDLAAPTGYPLPPIFVGSFGAGR